MTSKIGFCLLLLTLNVIALSAKNDAHFKELMKPKIFTTSQNDPKTTVLNLIQRVIGPVHDINDFIIEFDANLNNDSLDTFQLEMDSTGTKLQITANSIIAATWGFNYYLKYYCNSSVYWSGKNINLNFSPLPIVQGKVTISALDYARYYQNVCTYSYSYVWWDWERWEYEIDWMALNGINLVYGHTAAEYAWISVFEKIGLTRAEIDEFFTGPAYLAWLRMGNLKHFGGSLTDSWHADQMMLQRNITNRMTELGIRYILPAFAGFVPDGIKRIYPNKNFTRASNWVGFNSNFTSMYMVDPTDPLFTEIGSSYIDEIIFLYGTSHLYSADVFNEMLPKSGDYNYLAQVNAAVYNSMSKRDPDAIWVMQAWLFLDTNFWTHDRVKAFFSLIPIGRLLLLDLFSEQYPRYQLYDSYFGHLFVWNMIHGFGGANGMFGQISAVNQGPDRARTYPNSSMVAIGITMEGINQNEIIYEFMLEKSWRTTLSKPDLIEWIRNYTNRRYSTSSLPDTSTVQDALINLGFSVYDNPNYDHENRQLFTKRPHMSLGIENKPYISALDASWEVYVSVSDQQQFSTLFRYDLVDITKEVLRYKFSEQYVRFVDAYKRADLYEVSDAGGMMIEILNDMDVLLASDSHFLLGKWIEAAKAKATNQHELDYYEWNARTQISVWGANYTSVLFDYACKAWSGLIKDYYLPRWNILIYAAEDSLLTGVPINNNKLTEELLLKAELPFMNSKSLYPIDPIGDSITIVKQLYSKYGL